MPHDQGDFTVGATPVARVGRGELKKEGPTRALLIRQCRISADPSASRADLYQRFGMRLEIEPPGRVVQRTAIGRDQNEHAVNRQIQQ
jgi:hypothetical protein